MALARLTTWVDGNVLTAGALNAEFDNIIQNAVSLISPSTGGIDFGSYASTNFVLPTANITPGTPGRLTLLRSNINLVLIDTGDTAARIVGPHAGVSRVAGLTGSLASNIGSFAANSYQMQRTVIGGNVGNEVMANMSATSSFSINTQTAGPASNARDQAAAFAASEIHFYAVTTGIGSTQVIGVCSCTPPPIGPSISGIGYYWAYLCSAKYAAASSVLQLGGVVAGNRVYFGTPQGHINVGTSNVSSLTSAATGASLVIPTMASHMMLRPTSFGGGPSAGSLDVECAIFSASSGPMSEPLRTIITGSTAAFQTGHPAFTLPIIQSSPQLYYTIGVNSGTGAVLTVTSAGYIIPNGDV